MKKLIGILAISMITCTIHAQDSAKMKDTSMAGMSMDMHQMKKDCAMMKDGKVMVMKGGQTMVLDSTFTLNNGTVLTKDGTLKMTDGTTKMLKNGQSVDIDGKMWMSKKPMKDNM